MPVVLYAPALAISQGACLRIKTQSKVVFWITRRHWFQIVVSMFIQWLIWAQNYPLSVSDWCALSTLPWYVSQIQPSLCSWKDARLSGTWTITFLSGWHARHCLERRLPDDHCHHRIHVALCSRCRATRRIRKCSWHRWQRRQGYIWCWWVSF